jgi:hypothetical protein
MSHLILVAILGCIQPTSSAATQPEDAKAVVWRQLRDMPQRLGRHAVASPENRIYLLGGVDCNIRAGGGYGSVLRQFDPGTEQWTQLPPCPIGTGCAVMVADAANRRLIVLGGIRVLGDPLPKDGLEIAVYDVTRRQWKRLHVKQDNLGRPEVAFLYNGLVYFVTGGTRRVARGPLVRPGATVADPLPAGASDAPLG